MMDPWLGILLVAASLGGVLTGMSLARKIWRIPPEISRKTVHVVMGLCCLGFPLVFHSVWPVLLLCVSSLAALLWIRLKGGGLRAVLHGIDRISWGEICFPVAVALLFWLMEDPVLDYVVPLLILTLADAVGAIVGIRYGASYYTTDEGSKSYEGSLAFFVVAFLSTHVPLLLFTDIGRADCLLIGVLLGLLVMMIEAIAWRGLDNLFIPLGTYLMLQIYPGLGSGELMIRLAVLVAMAVLLRGLRGFTYARDGTLIAGVLLLYLIWVVRGLDWLWPPAALLAGYCFLCPRSFRKERLRHGLADLGAVAGMGFVWLFLSVALGSGGFYWAYTYSWAAQLSMIACAYLLWKVPGLRAGPGILAAGLFSGLFYLAPVLLRGGWASGLWTLPGLLVAVLLPVAAYWRFEWVRRGGTNSPGRPARQFAYGAIASGIGLVFLCVGP
ncbi:MAG: diacylglycerol/polyprenol kinase family protein [Puniceicoccaceae bacterium]